MAAPWTARDIPDQTGRTAVVTGANSGLGLETARELVRAGAHVVLAVRDTARGEAARRDVEASVVGSPRRGSAEVRRLDLADLTSVAEFAAVTTGPVDVLVANAGLMATPLRRTAQGFEQQFGVNFLGHFALTGRLLDRLTDRVVVLSSSAHRMGAIDLEDLNWDRRRYRRWAAYGQSKLADLMFAFEFQRRAIEHRSSLRAVAAHPGYAATNLQSRTETVQDRFMQVANAVVGQSAAMGALPTLYAATVPDVPGGWYIGPDGFAETRGHPRPVGSSKASHDVRTARALWEGAERLTGVAVTWPASP